MLERLAYLIQIVSGIILVVGVILVIVELRQAKALAQAQLISDSFAISAGRLQAQLGENSAAVITKACAGEEPLTLEEAGILSSKYQLHNLIAFREYQLNALFGFENVTWREEAQVQFVYVFRNQHGRAWYREMGPLFRELGEPNEFEDYRDALFEEYQAREECSPDVLAIYREGSKAGQAARASSDVSIP